MSKTFSNAGGNRDIRVIDDSGRGFVIRALDHDGARSIAVIFNNDTAPALALAILETAGVESPYYNLKDAVDNLRQHVEREAQYAEEAIAQAKLEAEALELLNVRRKFEGIEHVDALDDVPKTTRNLWLAVARRAREINKEDNNA